MFFGLGFKGPLASPYSFVEVLLRILENLARGGAYSDYLGKLKIES